MLHQKFSPFAMIEDNDQKIEDVYDSQQKREVESEGYKDALEFSVIMFGAKFQKSKLIDE